MVNRLGRILLSAWVGILLTVICGVLLLAILFVAGLR